MKSKEAGQPSIEQIVRTNSCSHRTTGLLSVNAVGWLVVRAWESGVATETPPGGGRVSDLRQTGRRSGVSAATTRRRLAGGELLQT